MDEFDLQILTLLQKNGRISNSDLSESVNLSLPAIADRIKKLEAAGAIKGYAAIIDGKKLGKSITAFISVQIDDPKCYDSFAEQVQKISELEECHHVVGEFDYLLKIKTKDTSTLEDMISKCIRPIKGVGRTRTTIVLSTQKETTEIFIDQPADKARRKKNG